jgi:predicted ATP-grasp superfamily ATP-dependent carboligase
MAHPDSEKLAEFRDKNIALLKELDELRPLKEKFEGVDPEAARAALAKLPELEGKLAELASRPDGTKLAEELATVRSEHAAATFKNSVTVEFIKAGGRESAEEYIVEQAAKVFAADGSTKQMSETNPGLPLTVAEWLENTAREHHYLFKPSSGGGARGNTNPPKLGATRRQGELRDPTPQQLGQHASDIASGKVKIVYS